MIGVSPALGAPPGRRPGEKLRAWGRSHQGFSPTPLGAPPARRAWGSACRAARRGKACREGHQCPENTGSERRTHHDDDRPDRRGPGLGQATARRFGRLGFSVALISRTQANVDDLAAEGTTARGYAANARDPQALLAALDAAVAELGPIEVLQYSPVPTKEFMKPVLETLADDLIHPVEQSVYGPVTAVQHVLPGLRALGPRPYTPHDLRQKWPTVTLTDGVAIHEVSRRPGHRCQGHGRPVRPPGAGWPSALSSGRGRHIRRLHGSPAQRSPCFFRTRR